MDDNLFWDFLRDDCCFTAVPDRSADMRKKPDNLNNQLKRTAETVKIFFVLILMKIGIAGILDKALKGLSRCMSWIRHFFKERAIAVAVLVGSLTGLLFLRACAYGYRYFPQLDDYIQYWYYPGFSSFSVLVRKTGLLGSRPLAGIMDFFVWSRLPAMTCVLILCLLFAASAVIFREVLRRYYDVSPLFLVLMTLLPLGMEGTYWLSASTRVITGIFFASLAVAVFAKWLDYSSISRLILFIVLMIVPYCFYEQAGVLSAAMVFVMAYWERRRKLTRGIFSLWAVIAAVLSLLVTRIFATKGSAYSSRTNYAVEKGLFSDLAGRWAEIFRQGRRVLVNGDIALIYKGFRRGLGFLLEEDHFRWLLAVFLLCVILGLSAFYDKGIRRHRKTFTAVWASLIWIFLPMCLFFVVPKPWICFRNAVTSFVGIAFILDHLLVRLLKETGGTRITMSTLAVVFSMVFMICGLSEIHDYKAVNARDQDLAHTVIEMIQTDLENGYNNKKDKFAVLGADRGAKLETNYRWNDHIEGCTSQKWAFTGLLRYVSKDRDFPSVVPLDASEIYNSLTKWQNDPLQFNHLYYYEEDTGEIMKVKLNLKKGSDVSDPVQYWEIVNEESEIVGILAEKKNSARIL